MRPNHMTNQEGILKLKSFGFCYHEYVDNVGKDPMRSNHRNKQEEM